MNTNLTVACVYWKGEFRKREKVYSPKWVERLQAMVKKNLSIPHRFVCLSNVDVPCERIPLSHSHTWPGWWSKIELFTPGLFKGRVLYLDLDLVVMKDLAPFVEYKSPFALIPSFGKPNKERGSIHKYNSSVMVFDPGATYRFFSKFATDSKSWRYHLRGDQDFLAYVDLTMDTFPKEWVTKLKYLKNGEPDPKAKVILCMPGKNTIASKKYPWIKKIWT